MYFASGPGGLTERVALYGEQRNALAVLRSPHHYCDVAGAWVAGDQTALMITDTRLNSGNLGTTSYFACGTGLGPVTFAKPTMSIGADLPDGTFSGAILAMDSGVAKVAEVLDIPAKQFHNLVAGGQGGDVYFPFAVGTDVLVRATVAPMHDVAELWTRPNTTETLIDPGSGRTVADVRSDGQSLVWVEADTPYDAQGNYPHGYLYAAPFVEAAAELQPKLLRELPANVGNYMPGTAGQGYYLLRMTVPALDLFRISDGRHWVVAPPAGFNLTPTPLVVGSTYAVYGVATKPGLNLASTYIRQRVDALGSGD